MCLVEEKREKDREGECEVRGRAKTEKKVEKIEHA